MVGGSEETPVGETGTGEEQQSGCIGEEEREMEEKLRLRNSGEHFSRAEGRRSATARGAAFGPGTLRGRTWRLGGRKQAGNGS